MKMVGGAIGVVAGLILLVISIIDLIDFSGATSGLDESLAPTLEAMGVTAEDGDYVGALEAKLEELRAAEPPDEAQIAALEAVLAGLAEAQGAIGGVGTWIWIGIIGGAIAAVVGFLVIKGTGTSMPAVLAVVGVALTVLAFILVSAYTLVWILSIVIVVGGVIAFLGAKQTAAPAV
jgi:hypothetical protein